MEITPYLIYYTLQAAIAAGLNSGFTTRIPRDFADLIKLTFLPYVVYCLIFDKNKLI